LALINKKDVKHPDFHHYPSKEQKQKKKPQCVLTEAENNLNPSV